MSCSQIVRASSERVPWAPTFSSFVAIAGTTIAEARSRGLAESSTFDQQSDSRSSMERLRIDDFSHLKSLFRYTLPLSIVLWYLTLMRIVITQPLKFQQNHYTLLPQRVESQRRFHQHVTPRQAQQPSFFISRWLASRRRKN